MRYDAATDKYVPVSWDEAFALVGRHLRGLGSPDEAAFYTSGRLSNEATFLYQLWARELGTNNLPDCSNMCHEASGRALQAAIGTGKGTCDLVDWQKTDCLVIMGVNASSNAPRMLTSLAEAFRRGASIVHVNPLIEAAARRTIVPHDILRMATFQSTRTGTLDVQPRIAGDMALMRGVAKHLFESLATDPGTKTPWADYGGDYDLIRDKMAEAIDGFEDFNRRVRQPLGFRLKQPARELVFLTKTGKAEFWSPKLADVAPAGKRLLLGTMRSHDQWNTTIYSDNDRYRGVKNLRTLVFMNADDMRDRGLQKYDLIDVTSFAKDGSTHHVYGYRAIPYNLPRGSTMGYMPEPNSLCPIGDYSPQSDQPLMKHLIVEINPSAARG